MNRILLLEDDVSLIDGLVYSLKKNEFDVEVARTVCEAKQYLSELDRYDLLILDVTLPDGTGFDVCERVRKENQQIPIIFLTASDEEVSIIRGLDSGGDDYITKPFSLKNLYARIQAVWRRSDHDLKPLAEKFSWNAGDLVIDYNRKEVLKKGETISLTPIEWKILSAFTRYPQKVFTRDELIASAFDTDFSGYDRVIDTHIKNLRKKIEDDPKNPIYLCTVHGIGYKFGGNI